VKVDPAQLSSLDRPQHSFLEPLTLNPLATIAYICLGATVLQTWWAGYVRDWWSLSIVDGSGSENEKRLEKAIIDRQKIKVCFPRPNSPIPDFRHNRPGFHDCMACDGRRFHHLSWPVDFVRRAILLVRMCHFIGV
jgi:hypothetical protein